MFNISFRSVCYRWPLFVGSFIALCLSTALIGITVLALSATTNIQLSSATLGPTIKVTDGSGTHYSISKNTPDMGGIQTVLALSGAVSAIITIFIVASTFAFSVALRERDLGLLRLVGASSTHIRRIILGESLVVAIPAAFTGCLVAVGSMPIVLGSLNNTALTPVPLQVYITLLPIIITFCAGLLIAVLGALASSQRASRTRPIQALREAVIDKRAMNWSSWIMGLFLLIAGSIMTMVAAGSNAETATPLSIFGPIVLAIAAILISPVYLPFLAQLLTLPLKFFTVISGRLASAGLATARRRAASLAAPILAILAIVGILTSILATTAATTTASQQANTLGQLIITTANESGLNHNTLEQLQKIDGIQAVSAPGSLPVVIVGQDTVERQDAVVADLPTLAAIMKLQAVEGTLETLLTDTVAVSREYASWYDYHPGSKIKLALFDGRLETVTITALIDAKANTPQLVVSPNLAKEQYVSPQQATILLEKNFSPTNAAQQITDQLDTTAVKILSTEEWFKSTTNAQESLNQLVLFVLVAPASIYALIAIANTLIMAYSQRGREVAAMRLLGITGGQVERMILWEILSIGILGVMIASLIIALALQVYQAALFNTYAIAIVSVPWIVLISLTIACLLTALIAGLFSIRHHLRKSAVQLVTSRE